MMADWFVYFPNIGLYTLLKDCKLVLLPYSHFPGSYSTFTYHYLIILSLIESH